MVSYHLLHGFIWLFSLIIFCIFPVSYFCSFFVPRNAFSTLTSYTKSCKIGTVNKQYKPKKKNWDSARIQAFRQHLGLTQRELAERLGTRQQTISEWETGMYQPRGASATLLSIVAEQSKFKYDAGPPKK
jgi:DNA-binding transcriptional regulator YiaG